MSAPRGAFRRHAAGEAVLLVVAKAPVAGLAKTRLAPAIGARNAARLAAAALLDTVDSVRAVPDTRPVVALTGDLSSAEQAALLAEALSGCTVLPQRGDDFGDRLANAHADVAKRYPGLPVLQIGMDTPQVGPELLTGAVARLLADDAEAVLGPATDGGWWALGLRDPLDAHVVRAVPMSRADTGSRTLRALRDIGRRAHLLPVVSDVDTLADAARVAALAPDSRFARAFADLDHVLPHQLAEANR
jgi:glycosyltransferase A (GT-A) superfamily protein (DUF2064 family)